VPPSPGGPGQTRPPTWSSGNWDRTAATRTGRSAANPSSRSARALAAWSLSALITSSTRGGVGHGGARRAVALHDRRGGHGEPVQQQIVEPAGRAGAFQPTVPISSWSRAIGTVVNAGDGGAGAGRPSGPTRMVRPVPWSRIPATHSARPAEARASAGRSTRRRIGVS